MKRIAVTFAILISACSSAGGDPQEPEPGLLAIEFERVSFPTTLDYVTDLAFTPDDTGEFLTDDSAFEVRAWTVTANLKGYILTEGDVQPFLLLGGGMISGELDGRSAYGASADGFSFLGRMGGGLDYYFTPHIVGVAELTYVLPTGTLKDFPYISGGLGLQYRF